MNTTASLPVSISKKYSTLVTVAQAAGYEIQLLQDDDGSALLSMEHPDHKRRDILDSDKNGSLYYIQINPWGSDVARHYNHNTSIDLRTSVANIIAILTLEQI